MDFKIIEDTNRETELFIKNNNGHVLQSYQWGEIREKEGHKVIRCTVTDKENNIVIYSQLVLHRLPRWYPSLSKYVCEVWRGPIIDKNRNINEIQEALDTYISNLKELGKKEKIMLIKFEPNIEKDTTLGKIFSQQLVKSESTFVKGSGIIDLDRDIDTIFNSFNKYTKKNIRKSINKGVEINISRTKEEHIEAINRIYPILTITSNRADFRIRPLSFYQSLIDLESDNLKIRIVEAFVNNNLAASYFALIYNNTVYTPYSGSNREYSEYKANELINYELIKEAKSLNCTRYDQWGILPTDTDPKDPMWGVSNFKLGFNGKREEYIGAYDLIIDHISQKIFTLAWDIRKVLNNTRKLIKRSVS
mgnify:CR=1 FL=1